MKVRGSLEAYRIWGGVCGSYDDGVVVVVVAIIIIIIITIIIIMIINLFSLP